MSAPFIRIKGLVKHYLMGGQVVRALDGVDLDVHKPAPFLFVRMKSLHVTRVTIPAPVTATDVAVERVIIDSALVKQILSAYFTYGYILTDQTPHRWRSFSRIEQPSLSVPAHI